MKSRMEKEFVLIAATKGVIEGNWSKTIEFIKKQNPCWFPWTLDLYSKTKMGKEKINYIEEQMKSLGYIDLYIYFSKDRIGNSGEIEYVCRIIEISKERPINEYLIAYEEDEPPKTWFKTEEIKELDSFLNYEKDFLDYRGIIIDGSQFRKSIVLCKRKKREGIDDL